MNPSPLTPMTLLAAAISTTLTAGVAYAQLPVTTPSSGKPSVSASAAASRDAKFVATAGQAGAAEVAMGRLAQDHASSSDVKGLAARVVSDHEQAGDQLKSIAAAKGMSPPEQLSKKDQSDLDKLSKLQGTDFDKAYVKSQLSAHKDVVALFNSESKNGKDSDLRRFAASTLPTLEDHLQMVQQLSRTAKS